MVEAIGAPVAGLSLTPNFSWVYQAAEERKPFSTVLSLVPVQTAQARGGMAFTAWRRLTAMGSIAAKS
jgi:hypothetical protein